MAAINLRIFIVLVILAPTSSSWAVEFEELVRNPDKFHNQRVTFVAMANVGGDRFYLYRPPEPSSMPEYGREIYGVLHVEGPIYDRFNNKWVQVTGIVDANYRGLFSENACSLKIERVRPAGNIQSSNTSNCDGSCIEIQFSQLLKDPAAYQHKRVCVTGFAHVFGDAFAIYESVKAAAKRDFAEGIFVAQKFDGPDYNQYNMRWIKITGTVEMGERGWANYPCGILVERVKPASPGNTENE